MSELLSSGYLWTNAADLDRHASGLTPFCRLTFNLGERVAAGAGDKRNGWAWTRPMPGALVIAQRLAGRFVADIEVPDSRTPAHLRDYFWRGLPHEATLARQLAPLSAGVTSHGFVKAPLRKALRAFAELGLPAFPQVYDGDRSTLTRRGGPVGFLDDCVSMYTDLGFRAVVPLLGLHSGADSVRAWIDRCEARGLPWHIWRAGHYRARLHAFLGERLRRPPQPAAPSGEPAEEPADTSPPAR